MNQELLCLVALDFLSVLPALKIMKKLGQNLNSSKNALFCGFHFQLGLEGCSLANCFCSIRSVFSDQNFFLPSCEAQFFFLRSPGLFLVVQLIVVCVLCFLLFLPLLSLGKDLWVLGIVAASSFSCLARNRDSKMEVPLPVGSVFNVMTVFTSVMGSQCLLTLLWK